MNFTRTAAAIVASLLVADAMANTRAGSPSAPLPDPYNYGPPCAPIHVMDLIDRFRADQQADDDIRCLEALWPIRDMALDLAIPHAWILLAARQPAVLLRAAGERPEVYRAWIAHLRREGLPEHNLDREILREATVNLGKAKPNNAREAEARTLFVDALAKVRLHRIGSFRDLDPCEHLRMRYGNKDLAVVEGIGRDAQVRPTRGEDLECLEEAWREPSYRSAASRALLEIAARQPLLAAQAAGTRAAFATWMDQWERYPTHHSLDGELVRKAISSMEAAKPRDADGREGQKLLLRGLRALKPK